MEYYLYVYLDPRKAGVFSYGEFTFDHEPFYVGKGHGSRKNHHLYESEIKRGNSSPKVAKIRKLQSLELKPIILEIKHFSDETTAYNEETKLIQMIGSDFISDIKDGPLTNMMITSDSPPSHRGKSYLEIYKTPERAEEQRAKRHAAQLAVGGYFKGGKHTEEVKKKAKDRSKKLQENGGFRLGIAHTDKCKAQMKYIKQISHNPACKLYTITDGEHIYKTAKLNRFCIYNKISESTLRIFYDKNLDCKSGKTKGWKILKSAPIDVVNDKKYARCIFTKEKRA
ncbi:MAG: GIY-YIG nuclease family protein [Ignavibacteriae bacterium]|nr:GIY-YIG nuclease family protein [Ignavibacteriota bacterium]